MSCGKYTDILYCGNYIQYIGWFMYCFTKWENFCPVKTVQDDSSTVVTIYDSYIYYCMITVQEHFSKVVTSVQYTR